MVAELTREVLLAGRLPVSTGRYKQMESPRGAEGLSSHLSADKSSSRSDRCVHQPA